MREFGFCIPRQYVSKTFLTHLVHKQVLLIDVLDPIKPLLSKRSVSFEQNVDPDRFVQIVLVWVLFYRFFCSDDLFDCFRSFLLLYKQVLVLLHHLLGFLQFDLYLRFQLFLTKLVLLQRDPWIYILPTCNLGHRWLLFLLLLSRTLEVCF